MYGEAGFPSLYLFIGIETLDLIPLAKEWSLILISYLISCKASTTFKKWGKYSWRVGSKEGRKENEFKKWGKKEATKEGMREGRRKEKMKRGT